MAAGSLYQMLDRVLLSDTRALMGGDVEIESSQAIDQDVLDWIAQTGKVSLVRELDTMMSTDNDDFALVELLSTDSAYPLYGELTLSPAQDLSSALANTNGQWGVAIDPILAERSNLTVGDTVYIGDLTLQVRALIVEQPDRRLNANWRGLPVLMSEAAMDNSGLIIPGSRVEYEYRISTNLNAQIWEENFVAQFPNTEWEIQTFEDRSQRISQRLSQIASGLLIVAFSTLFIGGLGVFNSISVYLQSKRETIATLKACGLRDARIGQVFVFQVAILAGLSGLVGIAVGAILAILGSTVLAQDLPVSLLFNDIALAAVGAWAFGIVTAFAFALPALGRALQVDVAHLFRANTIHGDTIGSSWRIAGYFAAGLLAVLVLFAIPNVMFGLAFLATVIICLGFFEGVVRLLRMLSLNMERRPSLARHAATRLALANMHRAGRTLRITLLSLGTALTLLVACSVIVIALLRLVQTTIPEEAPAFVLYDVLSTQKESVEAISDGYDSINKFTIAPMVRGRISAINNTPIRELAKQSDSGQANSDEINWQDMARDEHKLSYLAGNIDGIDIIEGKIWDQNTLVQIANADNLDFAFVMEDREANQMRLNVGDTSSFTIEGIERTGLLTGIYTQKGIQTRFWFEAIFSDGALDDFINAYVATVYMDNDQALALQSELARTYPNIITVRTQDLIDSASELLSKGTNGLTVISSISLFVSLMVLASVMAAGRAKQSYHAIILFSLGARLSYIRRAITIEYGLLAMVVSVFSIILGLSIAVLVLQFRLKIFVWDVYWFGAGIAILSSVLVFGFGALYLFQKLKIQPAQLLKESA
jgi:putative ABC transport system permease protein